MITHLQNQYSSDITHWRKTSQISTSEREAALKSISTLKNFSLLPEKLRADKEIAFYAIHQFSWNILYTTAKLQIDHDLLLIALIKEPTILQQLSPYVKNDKTLAVKLLNKELEFKEDNHLYPLLSNSSAQISYYSKYLKKDESQSSFRYFDRFIRNDLNLAQLAIKIDFLNYSHIGYKLKENVDLALYSISINPRTYLLFNDKLKRNQDICNSLLSKQGDFIDIVSPDNLNEQNISDAISNNPLSMFLIPDQFKNNKNVCLKAVSINGFYLRELSYEMRNDFDIASAALFNTVYSLQFFTKKYEYIIENFRLYKNMIDNDMSQWESFPYYFHSFVKQEEMLKKLDATRRFSFDDPNLNTLETDNDLYINEDDDESGSQGDREGNIETKNTERHRKKI